MITLCSYDGEEFDIDESVAKVVQMIKNMTGDDCAESVIPLPDVNSKVRSKVIEYLKKHVDYSSPKSDEKAADEELKAWDAEFVKIDRAMFHDLIMEVLQEKMEYELLKFDNKVRFILSIVEGKIIFSQRSEDWFLKGFTPFPTKTKDIGAAIEGATVNGVVRKSDYEYLLSMSIRNLFPEGFREVCADKQKLENKLKVLKSIRV